MKEIKFTTENRIAAGKFHTELKKSGIRVLGVRTDYDLTETEVVVEVEDSETRGMESIAPVLAAHDPTVGHHNPVTFWGNMIDNASSIADIKVILKKILRIQEPDPTNAERIQD